MSRQQHENHTTGLGTFTQPKPIYHDKLSLCHCVFSSVLEESPFCHTTTTAASDPTLHHATPLCSIPLHSAPLYALHPNKAASKPTISFTYTHTDKHLTMESSRSVAVLPESREGTEEHQQHVHAEEAEVVAAPAGTATATATSSEVSGSLVGNSLVSEHEDDDDDDDDDDNDQDKERNSDKDSIVKAGTSIVNGSDDSNDGEEVNETNDDVNQEFNDEEEDEEDYEYEYEDEDDTQFGGLLATNQVYPSFTSSTAASSSAVGSSGAPAHIIDDSEPPEPPSSSSASRSDQQNSSFSTISSTSAVGSSASSAARKSTWREPSKQAVSMSLRAEREKTGGKRRLAADLSKIMMSDTREAGFTMEPQSEDSMEKWTIKLFQFDEDSKLHKDMLVLGIDHIELEMRFPEDYPFEPPFVRVVSPKFERQTGFVMNGALCMELLTKDGWKPVNDIESVIVSIRSLLVVGEGRLAAATEISPQRRQEILASRKRGRDSDSVKASGDSDSFKMSKIAAGRYTLSEAEAAHSHLTDYHKKKGWDTSGWWARKG